MTAFIELQDLSKNYSSEAGSYAVLKNLNLTIGAGEFVALMGPSGSGKSTLMNILGCLDIPSSGKYFLDGNDVSALNFDRQAWVRSHTIGFIFQGFNLLPRASLEINVALPLVYAGVERAIRMQRAHELLTKVGLGARFTAMPNQISGGEQQRVAIARALANHPKLILADEPTGNLDTATSTAIMKIFTELNNDGITIFLVTHESDIAAYAKRQIHLRDGVIIEDKPTKQELA
jgi:putative ABC transport system ATP-binding protein